MPASNGRKVSSRFPKKVSKLARDVARFSVFFIMFASKIDITIPGAFFGKRVLVFGLGVLGGGIATTNWLLGQGAKVTVTDLKDEEELASSLRQLTGVVKLRLGGHNEEDIRINDIIVFNPDIHVRNPYVLLAQQLGKRIENEATLFYQLNDHPIVAVTGTRGKTTTTNWIRHLLGSRYGSIIAGNSSADPLLKMLDRMRQFESSNGNRKTSIKPIIVVNELPSYHLEYFDLIRKGPDIAVITNLHPDHLNRYSSMADYANTKANIFINQSDNQHLVLNYDNQWTPFFFSKRPRSTIWCFSMDKLPSDVQGVYFSRNSIFFQDSGQIPVKVLSVSGFADKYGVHNLENLLACSLAAYLTSVPWIKMQNELDHLPRIPFRQETVFETERVKIINDTTATTPEGSLVAIKRFACPSCILITGGTDRGLDYTEWSRAVVTHMRPNNIVMLSGSATDKMLAALGSVASKVSVNDSLSECVKAALAKASKYPRSVILFSPAAKSFEKFRNEMDRGKQFNKLVKKESQKWMKH